jgi:glycosyltransferase involved in cell wall biosynthesis
MRPYVSVLVATRNRQALLASTLDALLAQEWPRHLYEIVVADNGSSDETAAVVRLAASRRDACAVRYVFVQEPGKSRALNAALPLARGEILALTDDDVKPEPLWLDALTAAFGDDVQFVAGRVRPDWTTPAPRWLSEALHGVLAVSDGGAVGLPLARGVNEHIMPIGANMAVRADVMKSLGGFRTDLGKLEGTLRTGEDHEFYLRLLHAGYHGRYEPSAVVHHRVGPERLHRSYFTRWFYQNGRDVAVLERSYPVPVRRLLGVPRYLWRQTLRHVAGAVSWRATDAQRFAALLRAVWFAGHARETWLGVRSRRERRTAAGPAGAPLRAS